MEIWTVVAMEMIVQCTEQALVEKESVCLLSFFFGSGCERKTISQLYFKLSVLTKSLNTERPNGAGQKCIQFFNSCVLVL